jgi:hypothetical protein
MKYYPRICFEGIRKITRREQPIYVPIFEPRASRIRNSIGNFMEQSFLEKLTVAELIKKLPLFHIEPKG